MLLAQTAWHFILLHELLRAGLKLDNLTFRVQNVTFQETDTNYFPGMNIKPFRENKKLLIPVCLEKWIPCGKVTIRYRHACCIGTRA